MNSDILLRFGLALGIMVSGVVIYWYLNQRLLARAQGGVHALVGAQPDKPTIVYFTTPDCAPCKTIQRPALEKLTSLFGEGISVIEIDASQNPELAKTWGVMSVPTTFLLDQKGAAKYVNTGVARLEKLMEQVKTL
ncbi:MAG: thioredoxin family protein [Anaerolineales bacterium]|jgi:thioredoxin 1|nr:thioredoxin family protein [Anaerolineales bacterium]